MTRPLPCAQTSGVPARSAGRTGGPIIPRSGLASVLPTVIAWALAGCSGASGDPAASAAAAAEALKSQGARDAQVQMQDGSFRATLTQADGQQAQMAVGAGTVHPADFGAPWFPGAQADAERSSRLGNADGQVVTVVLRAPAELEAVARFYRERLTPSESRAVREAPTAEGGIGFVVADNAAHSATQVLLQPVAGAVEVTLLTTRRAPR